ncbi:hypothetical protein RHMOL_Rhmol11G0182100 [Rhododendron molle]|uniref:Uncharacterized protein n=1 Tax=Rhododendron molle TaxID=49168 RepID=A0ACC0LTC6_RHOML|nr:hypothetical protein RHMOL_Rhmol11G0182100 [Rhododendron molle]
MADGILAIGGLVVSAVQTIAQAKQVFWDPPTEKDDLPNNVEEIIDDLNDELRKLGSKSKDFKTKVLKNKTKAPSETYLEWVRNVEEIDKQVKDLLDKYDKQSKEGLSWWFTSSPDFRKDFKKIYKKVKSLVEESNQIKDEMFVDLPPELVVNKEGKNNNFGIREKQIEKILELLESSKAKKIGILGTVGIGKTTMMRSLNNYEKVTKTFEIVICLDVSQEGRKENLSREDLLQANVRRLKLNIRGSYNADEIAQRILMELQNRNFLLLLDDVKQCFNLKDIGIPESDDGCKIVLTTRLRRVCRSMVDHKIKVTYLSEDEAWKMFQDVLKCPELLEDLDIRKLARKVCKECSGVPLLIKKVASTFRSKDSLRHWSDGLNSWRMWPEKEREGIREMYNMLKFCYDDLDDERRQKCFLYGALYPEGSVINADYLLECWAAEHLLGDFDSITKESLICGHLVLSYLKYVSLLEEGESENHVTMHKCIRNLALYIAEGDPDCKYMVETSKRLREPPKVESWSGKNRISFGDNKLEQLPASPDCSILSTLFLQKNSSLKIIPHYFFKNMIKLRVLDVSHTGIEELPSSLSTSIGLKVLYLNNCKNLVELPAPIVEALKLLEALDIVGSGVNNIPSHIEKLTRLRRLRVSFSKSGNENATQEVDFNYKIISKLCLLEELVIDVKSPEIWSNDVVENIIKEVATLKEFSSLKFCFSDKVEDVIEVFGSQNLRIRVPDATILLNFIERSSWRNVQDIENFEFYIGSKRSEQPQLPNFDEYEKYVKYCEVEGRNSPILEALAEATAFELVDNKNIKQLSDEELERMNGIQSCLIEGCDAIETIAGTSGRVVLPSLEHLFIKNLPMLESILRGPLQPGSLTKLTTLELTGCETLVKVFPPGTIQELREIQCLKIEKCGEIEEIIPESEARGTLLPKLKKMILLDMEKLRIICAINETLNWPSLEKLEIFKCPGMLKLPFSINNAKNLERIDAEQDWWGKLQLQNNEDKARLHKLCKLR